MIMQNLEYKRNKTMKWCLWLVYNINVPISHMFAKLWQMWHIKCVNKSVFSGGNPWSKLFKASVLSRILYEQKDAVWKDLANKGG